MLKNWHIFLFDRYRTLLGEIAFSKGRCKKIEERVEMNKRSPLEKSPRYVSQCVWISKCYTGNLLFRILRLKSFFKTIISVMGNNPITKLFDDHLIFILKHDLALWMLYSKTTVSKAWKIHEWSRIWRKACVKTEYYEKRWYYGYFLAWVWWIYWWKEIKICLLLYRNYVKFSSGIISEETPDDDRETWYSQDHLSGRIMAWIKMLCFGFFDILLKKICQKFLK